LFEKILNKLEKRVTYISNQDYKPGMFSLERFLAVLSNCYGLAAGLRVRLYEKEFIKQRKLPCVVISIGNIVAGGAGKTPMAIYLAGLLKEMGKKVVVISRGYKGKYKDNSLIVSDGNQVFSGAGDSGDEPYMMAKRGAFPVVVGKDRFKAGIKAINTFNPDVIILDDGFQHLKLKRDIDLLLLDHLHPFGNKRFLPAGRLRETPGMSAKRSDAIIFTRSRTNDEKGRTIKEVLKFYPGCPWFKTFHEPFIYKHIIHDQNLRNRITDISMLKGKKAVLFSGIAKNQSFYHTMKESGINVLDHLEFKDHYRYKKPDVSLINKTAEKVFADVILTTEKDWAKLDSNIEWKKDLVVVGINICFQDPERFRAFLNKKLKTYNE